MGDLLRRLLVLVEATDSAGDMRPVSDGAIDSVRALDGRVDAGGRMEDFLIRLLGRCVAMVNIDGIETVNNY